MNLMEICDAINWIHLAQDRDRWQVLVNTVIKFEIHKNFWGIERLSDL
jgi:hypothetical protein